MLLYFFFIFYSKHSQAINTSLGCFGFLVVIRVCFDYEMMTFKIDLFDLQAGSAYKPVSSWRFSSLVAAPSS